MTSDLVAAGESRESVVSQGFDAPDDSRGQHFLRAEAPASQDLRALIHAFEPFLGFSNRFDGSDPKVFGPRRVQCDAQSLPTILQMKNWTREFSAKTQALRARGSFDESVAFGWRKKIHNGFNTDDHRPIEGLLELEPHFAGDLAAVRRGPKRETFGDINSNWIISRHVRADQRLAIQLRLMWCGTSHGEFAARKTSVFH